LWLIAVLALAAALRLLWTDAGWFGADQARDLTWGARIATGEEYPGLGPVMRNRVHLGALYYYFWAIPFLFSSAPEAVYVFAALLGVLATALTFEVGRRVAGATAGLAAALVFATTPLAVIDGRMAWAPAALPVLCAAFLLSLAIGLHRPSFGAAVVTSVLAALAVQLHLAAAPLVPIAVVAVLWSATTLGIGVVVVAGLAGVVTLTPTLWALTAPAAAPGGGGLPVDTTAGRLLDMLSVGGRALAGVSPAPSSWPWWVDFWVGAESAWVAIVLLCAGGLLLRLPRLPRAAPAVAVVATLLASLLAALLLPWEAWYYYLDLSLVPAAVVVGVFVSTALGRPGWWLLVVLAAGRTAMLVWWIHTAHTAGYVAANLDLLRLGGPRAADPGGRARIPTVAARRVASEALVHGLGLRPPDLWQRAHGPGFSDLDSDNGYFFERAAATAGVGGGPSDEDAVVVYRGDVPTAWRSSFAAPIVAGPFEILRYEPWLDSGRARLLGCGDGPAPARPVTTPLGYGAGELVRSRWPCDDPLVVVPLSPRSDGADAGTVRVFARIDGPGRVVELDVEPPATARPLDQVPARLGRGIAIEGGPTRVRVRLALDGPASLDLFELRGDPPAVARGGTDSSKHGPRF